MVCVKCRKDIPDSATFCPWCGKKQVREPRKALKRANGMGSAYKLTAPRLRRPWVASKNKVVLGYYPTKTDALTALEAVSNRDLTEWYNITFEDAYKAWSDEHFRAVGEKGEEAYKNAFKNHATMLYNRKMRDLRTADYQEAIDTLDKAGKSRSTMEKLQQLFGQLSRWAVREEISTTDFAQFVKLPQREKAEKETFSEEEIQTLFNNDADSTVEIILILIYTGVRIGELFSVPKSDVDVQGGYMIGGEKTKAGRNRIIAFPDCIINYVKQLYDKAPDDGLLIDGYDGDKKPNNFRKRQYYPTLERLGIRKLNPHCTRHTFITRAIKQGVDMDEILRLVGHVDKETTQLYLHDDAGTIRDIVKSIR